ALPGETDLVFTFIFYAFSGARIMCVTTAVKSAAVSMALLANTVFVTNAGAAGSAGPDSEFSLSANMALTTQYRFRGIMQSNNKPAVQGGFDVSHSSGLYLGNWNSSI